MATKAATAEAESTEQRPENRDDPLIDSANASIKKLVARGKERGYITYDELNGALPPDQVSSEQIEDVLARLSDMGVNVVENEEAEEASGSADAAREV